VEKAKEEIAEMLLERGAIQRRLDAARGSLKGRKREMEEQQMLRMEVIATKKAATFESARDARSDFSFI
jgi:hypothetical protein